MIRDRIRWIVGNVFTDAWMDWPETYETLDYLSNKLDLDKFNPMMATKNELHDMLEDLKIEYNISLKEKNYIRRKSLLLWIDSYRFGIEDELEFRAEDEQSAINELMERLKP